MFVDDCGCAISVETAAGRDAWNALVRAMLSHSAQSGACMETLAKVAPRWPLVSAAKGLFGMMLARRETVAAARDAYATAVEAARRGAPTAREMAWIDALGFWIADRPRAAADRIEEALYATPQDTATLKIAQGIRFMIGDRAGMLRAARHAAQAHAPGHPLRGYALGCLAFTLEETGAYAQAEQVGLSALVDAPDDAWGLHAVAHVYDMTGRPDTGIQLIETHTSAWDHCNNFRYHVWWHKALLHLDREEYDIALALYDDHIRADKTDDYRDFSNAASLLTRLQLDGVAVGTRWDELSALAETRLEDGCLVFADLHYMLALCSDAPASGEAMVARMADQADAMSYTPRRYADPGHAAALGLSAFGAGRYAAAFDALADARAALPLIGGSHAQRDVFERVTIDAGIRAGRLDAARAILDERTTLRAGKDDGFARARRDQIARMRHETVHVAAQ